ncbi:peptidase, partial [Vibrio xuii]
VEAVKVLEDSPHFNAGKGSVLTNKEMVEMDASVMHGKEMEAGAVAGVKHIKNPIELARDVMTNSKHVLLIGEGAEEFAFTQGYEYT